VNYAKVSALYYFSDYLSVYVGEYSVIITSILSLTLALLTFLGIDFKTIKLQLKKLRV